MINGKKIAKGNLEGEQKILDTKILGKIVQQQRKIMGLSQVELAGICGVGIRFLSDLENGKATIELRKVLMVLQGLGLELALKKKSWDK